MAIVVQKYGGSSVADTYKISTIAERIVRRRKRGDDLVVVVSAMADTTDDLIELARRIDSNPPEREFDMLLTAGERISMALLSIALHKLDERAVSFTGSQSGIITDDNHTRARIIEVRPTRIIETLNTGMIAIVAGFQGVSGKKDVTTLGRGGSDTTAVALGVALGAEICEIYTDVEGLYSADPNRIPEAEFLEKVTFEEALEMAYFGAKVLHSRAVELARVNRLKLRVASSLNEKKGTFIVEKIKGMERPRFVGISRRNDICMCYCKTATSKELSELFGVLEKQRIRVGFPRAEKTRDGWNISFWADSADAAKISQSLENIEIDDDVCLLALVGEEISQRPEVVGEILRYMSELNIEPLLIDATQVSVVAVARRECGNKLEQALHSRFVRGEPFGNS